MVVKRQARLGVITLATVPIPRQERNPRIGFSERAWPVPFRSVAAFVLADGLRRWLGTLGFSRVWRLFNGLALALAALDVATRGRHVWAPFESVPPICLAQASLLSTRLEANRWCRILSNRSKVLPFQRTDMTSRCFSERIPGSGRPILWHGLSHGCGWRSTCPPAPSPSTSLIGLSITRSGCSRYRVIKKSVQPRWNGVSGQKTRPIPHIPSIDSAACLSQ